VNPTFDGCPGDPQSAVVNVTPQPVLTITNAAPSHCGNGSANISVSVTPPGTIVNWTVATTGTIAGAMGGSGTSVNQALTGVGTATYNFYAGINGCTSTANTSVTLTSNNT